MQDRTKTNDDKILGPHLVDQARRLDLLGKDIRTEVRECKFVFDCCYFTDWMRALWITAVRTMLV